MTNVLIRPAVFRNGAEESDSEGLERHLSALLPELHVFRLSANQECIILTIWRHKQIIQALEIPLVRKYSLRTRITAALIGDPACRYFLKLGIADSIKNYLHSNNMRASRIVTSNSSLLGVSLSIPSKERITRSVNFEPIHYLNEGKLTLKTPFVFLLKVWSTYLELLTTRVLPISPSDRNHYKRFVFGRIGKVLPLQHLQVSSAGRCASVESRIQIGFLGSTYSVKHNRDSFNFVVSELAEVTQNLPVHFNIYGVKAPEIRLPNNVTIHGWIDSIEEVYSTNDYFVIPFFGGTGMKSKLFEPICRGKLVIADPRAFSGYPFEPDLHYIQAQSLDSFTSAISHLLNNPSRVEEITGNAYLLARELFSPNVSADVLTEVLS